MLVRTALIGWLLSSSFVVGAQDAYVANGFATGEQYLAMPNDQQRAFAIGVVNGMLLAPLFGAPRARMEWIESCIKRMTDTQIAAILGKYLRDNPGRWHETPHAPMFSALSISCPK